VFPKEYPSPYAVPTPVEDEQLMREPPTKKQRRERYVSIQKFNQLLWNLNQVKRDNQKQNEKIQQQADKIKHQSEVIEHMKNYVEQLADDVEKLKKNNLEAHHEV
jgi:hypothetical protein